MFKKSFFTFFFFFVFLLLTPYFLIYFRVYAYSETTYYIHQDNLGSVVAITNQDGDVVDQNLYTSYGNQSGDTVNRNITERGYTGQIQDSSTSLQYYNARYYDPILSRFISVDQVQGGNRYAYVSNNPISRSDPSGNKLMDDIGDNYQFNQQKEQDLNVKNEFENFSQKARYYSQKEILNSVKGCGPTSLAMIFRGNPETLAQDMQAAGLFSRDTGTTINKIYKYAEMSGLNAKEYRGEKNEVESIFSLINKLNQPAIVAVHINYDLKRNGHIIVVLGRVEVDDRDMVAVYDPYLFKTKPEEFGGVVEGNVLFVPFNVFEENFKSQGSDFMFVGEERN